MWSVFPFSATLPSFLEECPGCFQIKWISCFGTLKNLGSNKLEKEGKWMTGLIFLMQVFCLKDNPYKQCLFQVLGYFLSRSFIYCFLLHCCWWVSFEAIFNQFWKYFIQFLCLISSVLTHSINPRNFSYFYLHQHSLQNNIELAPRHGTNTTCCQPWIYWGNEQDHSRP